MKYTTQNKIILGIRMLKRRLPLAVMAVTIIGFVLPVIAAPSLPREPMPKPHLPGTHPGTPKPPVHIGTRPHFDPSNIGALPDLKIVQVTPRLHVQAINACRTGRSPHGGLVSFDLKVKNIGSGIADLRRYMFAVHATSVDGRTPAMQGGDGYSRARRTPASVALGQIFSITGASGVTGGYYGHPVTFPVSRYSELAGKTRRFKVEIVKIGGPNSLRESNYRNNSRIVSFTFPRNFCQNTIHGGVSQTAPILKPHLVIQSIRMQLRRPYECRTDGPTFADGDLVLKNTGGDFIPASGGEVFNVDGRVSAGRNRLLLRSVGYLRSRIPSGATRHVRFAMTGTAGLLNTPTPPMSVLAGRTVSLRISLLNGVTGNRNSSIRFPSDFCASRVVGSASVPIGNQTIKADITGFQFARGKSCVSPRGIFTIKGSAFGGSAGGRTVGLGGNGMGVNLSIQSWGNRAIRVQLPRTARLQYRKNYWVRIQAPAVAGSARTVSNLKRGVVLCPPTVRAGGSGTASNPPAGHQIGRSINNASTVSTGLPDLEVTRLNISSPSPSCFSLGINPGWPKYYTLPKLKVSLTLHNKGRAPYSTFDAAHNKQLPIGIIGDRYVGPKDRHHISLCMVPVAHMSFSNLNIPAGGSKTIQTQMQVMSCPFRGGKVVNANKRLPDPLVRTLLGATRPVRIGIGKAVFIRNKIPLESNYDNNYGQTTFRFPSSTCGGR